MASATDLLRSGKWPTPHVQVSRGVSARAGAAAWAIAFAVELMAYGREASVETLHEAARVVMEHGRVLTEEGFSMQGPREIDGVQTWIVGLA